MRLSTAALPWLLVLALGCSSSAKPPSPPPELIVNAPIPGSGTTHTDCSWTQLGQNAAHTGTACAPAQGFTSVLATITVDPFAEQEVSDALAQNRLAALNVHYQAALVSADDVYVESKGGNYVGCTNSFTDNSGNVIATSADGGPCGHNRWETQVWSETHYQWQGGALVEVASFESDWKPPPVQVAFWEPLFHAALDGNVVWIPGVGGTVYRVDRGTMLELGQLNPLGATIDYNSYVAGPLTVAPDGTLLYNVVTVASDFSDVTGVLVRIEPDGVTTHAVDYPSLMVNPPAADGGCLGGYYDEGNSAPPFPWPPADDHRVTITCGSLRPGLNVAPAVGPDGTVFTVAFPNNANNAGVLLALNADLTPKWSASLQEILDDGCGVLIPTDAAPDGTLPDGGDDYNHCLVGAPHGVDPYTGQPPSVEVSDQSTSSPVVLPDGAVLYGGFNFYNNYRGHLVKFDATGVLVASYDDGWDQTPAVWADAGTYSLVVQDNHFTSWYTSAVGPFALTQVDEGLRPVWSSIAANTFSCLADGGLSCVSDHPTGFEWGFSAAAVDENGTVYANSEDGRVYALLQGGAVAQSRFLLWTVPAAYTPMTVDGQGRTYTLNGGVLTVVGK